MTIGYVKRVFGQVMAEHVLMMKEVHQTLRVALTGKDKGLDIHDIVDILGPTSSTARIDRAIREAGILDFARFENPRSSHGVAGSACVKWSIVLM